MRQRHPKLVPIEIDEGVPATLVINYDTAKRILHDPDHFSADPRMWQQILSHQWPGRKFDFMPMVEYRTNALRSDGNTAVHRRYRTATQDALAGVKLSELERQLRVVAHEQINSFCTQGAGVDNPFDLVTGYILPTMGAMLNYMVGSTPDIIARIAKASADLFDGQDTADTNRQLESALTDLIMMKRETLGDDITSRLIMHPAALSTEEIVQQLVTCLSAGTQLPADLAASALRLILTEFSPDGTALSTKTALIQVLVNDPPLANYLLTYPRHPVLVEDRWLPAHEPVIVSMAACSSNPSLNVQQDFYHDGWHFSWGLGPHECPQHAQNHSYTLITGLIDTLLDILPDIQLAVPEQQLLWRKGPFARGLVSLPVTFAPTPQVPRELYSAPQLGPI
ncbi:cytochrome P450 [Nocardia sp. NPDC050435]